MKGTAKGSSGTFSVVVATYDSDRAPDVRVCVDAILAGTVRPHEIVVVVDSNASLSQELRRALAGRARVLDSDGTGASATRNTGVRAASGEFIACIDDDAWPAPDWLDAYGRAFESQAGVVALAGHIVPQYEPGSRQLPPELLWLVGATYRGHRTDAGPVTRPIGANMAFRRDALVRVGGFDPDFGPVGKTRLNSNEEMEVSESLRKRFGSNSIWYVPDARVSHRVPARRTTLSYLIERCRAEGSSKARVRRRHGAAAMGDDAAYARRVLIPSIASLLTRGLLAGDARRVGDGFRLLLAAAVTAASYALTLARTRIVATRPIST